MVFQNCEKNEDDLNRESKIVSRENEVANSLLNRESKIVNRENEVANSLLNRERKEP